MHRESEAYREGGAAIDPAQLIQETIAQLVWFRNEVGRSPTHVDGHQHTHVLPGCAELLGPVLREAGVRHVRIITTHFTIAEAFLA